MTKIMFSEYQSFFSDGILDQEFGRTAILYFQREAHTFILKT